MPIGGGIQSIGTPVATLGTSLTTATSAWGTGQNRVAGHLLVAAVGFVNTTAGNILSTVTSGWTSIVNGIRNNAGSSITSVVFYATIATGGDAAPTVTMSNMAGTAASSITLFEFTNVNMSNNLGFPLGGCEATGNYASGGTAGTVAPSVTTVQNISLPGSYALYLSAMERATSTNTYTPNPGGAGAWQNVTNNGSTNSVGHFAVDWKFNPSTGFGLAASGSWTTETTAFESAQICVLQANQPPVAVPGGQDDLQANMVSISQALNAAVW